MLFSIRVEKIRLSYISDLPKKGNEMKQFVDELKGIVHFEINFWCVFSYLKGIQDVGVFVFTVVSILIFFRSNRSCLSVI